MRKEWECLLEISLSVRFEFYLRKLNALQGNSLQISALPSLSLVIFEISPLLDTTTKFSGVAAAFSKHSRDPPEPQHPETEQILGRAFPHLHNTNTSVGL